MISLWVFLLGLASAGTFRADLSKSNPINPYSANAGLTGVTYHFYVENQSSISPGCSLYIKFPNEFPDIGLAAPCAINGAAVPCVKSGSNLVVITATTTINPLTMLDIRVPGINNPTTAGGTSNFVIYSTFVVGNQILDINDRLGTIGIAASPASVSVSLAQNVGGSTAAGGIFNLLVIFTPATAVPASSSVRLTIPPQFTLSSSYACTLTANGASTAILVPLTCSYDPMELALTFTGFNAPIVSGAMATITISSLMNPTYVLSGGAAAQKLDIIQYGSYILLATGSASSLAVTNGAIQNVVHAAYFPGAQLVAGNTLYTKLSFSVTNPVPYGGSIVINYGLSIQVSSSLMVGCWAYSGINPYSSASLPSCSVSVTTATLTNFAAIAAGATVVIVNRITLGSTSLAGVSITTYNAYGIMIDQELNTQGGLTLASAPTFPSGSISYSQTLAGGAGNIVISITPSVDIPSSSTIKVYIPAGFALPTGATATCGQSVSGTSITLSTCTLLGSTLTMITQQDSPTTSATTITLGSTGSASTGWTFPALPSSVSNPYEWGVEADAAATVLSFGSYVAIVTSIPFAATTVVPEIMTASMYTPYVFSLRIDRPLQTTAVQYPVIALAFGTMDTTGTYTGFPTDLGTGLTSVGAIPCYVVSGLTSFSASAPLSCTLTPAASVSTSTPAVVSISSFANISAGSVITFKLFIENIQISGESGFPITISTMTYSYNSIQSVFQSQTFTFSTVSTATAAFTTLSLTQQTSTVIFSATNISILLRLSRSAATNDGDKLVISLPVGWQFPAYQEISTGSVVGYNYEIYSNSYMPTIICTLSTLGGVNGTGGSDKTFTLVNIINTGYASAGAGGVTVGVVDCTTSPSTPFYTETGTTSASLVATTPLTFAVTIEYSTLSQGAGDATYTFDIVNTVPIPAGGRVKIVFPSGFDLTYSSCKSTSAVVNLSSTSSKTCTVTPLALSVVVGSFAAIAPGTSFSVFVYTTKNPSVAVTNSFQVYTLYDSNDSHILENQVSGLTLTMTPAVSPATLTVSSFSMTPSSTNSISTLMLQFTLNAEVPVGGVLTITFPLGYTIPTLSTSNCILNFYYMSCTSSGAVITLVPITTFPAGYLYILAVPGVVVPTSSVASNPVSFLCTWNGMTILQNPSPVPTSFYFKPTLASTTAITATLTVWPTNVSEQSTHLFLLTLTTAITPFHALVIWFPVEYPNNLFDQLTCSSPAAMLPTQALNCNAQPGQRSVVITGFRPIPAGGSFNVTVRGVYNPSSVLTSSAFILATMNTTDYLVVDYLSTGLTATTTPAPGLLLLYNVTSSSLAVNNSTTFSFVAMTSNPVSVNYGQIWLTLPSHDYMSEVFGLSRSYNCSAKQYPAGSSGAWTNVFSSSSCIDKYLNFIEITGVSAAIQGGSYLSVSFAGVKNPSLAGPIQPLLLNTYDNSTSRVIDKTYTTTSTNYAISLTDTALNIYIDSYQGNLTVIPSVTQFFTIFTDSSSIPFKANMFLTPVLLTAFNTTGVTFVPAQIPLVQGQVMATFGVSVASTAMPSQYLVSWILSGDIGMFYSEPGNSMLTIVNNMTSTVTLDEIPTMMVNTTIPLNIYLEVAPNTGLTVNFTTNAGIYTVPSSVTFMPGQMMATFNLTVGNVALLNSNLNVTLMGPDAPAFSLASSSIFYFITEYDDEAPSIDSFVVNNPTSRLSLDVTIKTTTACYFYYLFGNQGLPVPVNITLMSAALNNHTGNGEIYGYEYIGGSLSNNLLFTGLQEETNYVLYGYLQDLYGLNVGSSFMINLVTADMADTVSFKLRFVGNQPTSAQLSGVVLNVLVQVFGLLTPSTLSYSPTGRRLQATTAPTYTYILQEDEYNEFPPPDSIVRSQADAYALAARLLPYNLTLDTTYSIINSLAVVENNRPNWIVYPYSTQIGNSSAVVIASSDSAGTMYLEVLEDNTYLPSSYQVSNLVDPFNSPFLISYSQPCAINQTVTFNITGLRPTYSYTVLVTVKNNNPLKPRVMSDDVMANIDVITGATIISTNSTSAAVALTAGLVWLVFS